MKKALTYWFGFLTLLLVLTLLLNSCKAKQPIKDATTEKTDKETVSDTKETVEVNKEILDEIIFKIAQINSTKPECDSLINHYRSELATSLAAYKKSGENQYFLGYNEATKQLELKIKIAETQNKTKEEKTHTVNNHTFYKTTEVPVHFMEWYEKMFYRIGQILSIVGVVYLIIKFKIF